MQSAKWNFRGVTLGHQCFLFFKLLGVMPPTAIIETPIPNQQVVRHGTSIESENYEGNSVVDDCHRFV